MNDLISRQAAIDALKAQADTMRTWVERYAEQRRGILTAVNIVEDIKPADVVPVVRCRDCKHWQTDWNPSIPDRHYCAVMDSMMKADDFCSYGKRREE